MTNIDLRSKGREYTVIHHIRGSELVAETTVNGEGEHVIQWWDNAYIDPIERRRAARRLMREDGFR